MKQTKPLKRDKALQPVSHDHHQGLLLCWKIRKGISKNVAPERMKNYTNWFFKTHLIPHFELEESLLFPILGNDHELIKKALAEHRRLKRLFEAKINLIENLSLIEEELEQHIRFEERILFQEIQNLATATELDLVAQNHTNEKFLENTEDEFWK
ncbi:hemerythrin domain-containing protein [Gillisia limnaea]|uniref:Hemerythrin-like domain-containing protein n=1 Tax=Gillisia limnaea (strain DSM 15749 / LMG 21470 / R-8282) TaxID=865937 RepID=H2BTA3_GILLR|nr:hemerythrin domain-containing protein [Gillisia limnaea]EHQ03702.1 hypothetical protein Gilli_3092 [Gillisia limnaea DSM 15749]